MGSSGARSGARRLSLRARAGLLLVLAVTAAGCAEGQPEAKPTTVIPTATPTPEPLTLQTAEREFRSYVTNDDVARAAGDERLALTWVADGQFPLTAAEFRKASFDGDPVRRYEYGAPKLWVPKLSKEIYPQWFVASVPRTVQGDPKSTRTALMAFILRSPGDRWKLSMSTVLAPKVKQPKVLLDAEGYATALGTTDASVLIRPREVPGIQATIASEGPGSVAAKVMKAGAVTTGYNLQLRKNKRRAKEKDQTHQTVFMATSHPIFPLRTEHEGGLVLYSLLRNSVLSVNAEAKAKGYKPPIPPEAAHLLDGTVKGTDINMSETLQFAALDPPRLKNKDKETDPADLPKAEVIAHDGALTKASTPPPKNP
ncbi:hypothetical protein [Spirillospora sp. CA-294931]|uniref:hypothetical protein n=1 Tax=Spirillospora sp. CA-294931 TaxID=3240042 RepID=UPI003D90CBE5